MAGRGEGGGDGVKGGGRGEEGCSSTCRGVGAAGISTSLLSKSLDSCNVFLTMESSVPTATS